MGGPVQMSQEMPDHGRDRGFTPDQRRHLEAIALLGQRHDGEEAGRHRMDGDLAVTPLFILMGQLATHGDPPKALFRFAAAFMGTAS